jgi:hypothetical protein
LRLWFTAVVAVGLATSAAAEPLRFFNGRLFIDARVNGMATEALLDSAAEATLVDPAFAAKAKLPEGTAQEIRGSGGTAKARIVEGVTINALGQELHPEAVVVTDLTELSRRLIKRPTQVVVGRELFDAARMRIDIKGGHIGVLRSSAVPKGKRLPLTTEHGVEAIPALVNGTAAKAEFDLGNGSGVLISRAFVNRLHLKIIGKKAGGGIGGAIDRDLVRLSSLEVAGTRFRNVVAAVDDLPNAGDLNIGTSILKDFLITTDFKGRAVWLHPLYRNHAHK